MSTYPDLKGKTAFITGAGRVGGLGAAMARRLASEGCNIVVADLAKPASEQLSHDAIGSDAEMQSLVGELETMGAAALAVTCNILEESDVNTAFERAATRFGGVDILVNNAGIGYLMKPLIELGLAEWDAVLGVNLRGAFLCTQVAARQMIERGKGGRIVNIASQAAKSGFPFASAYCSSKHGLIGLTRVAAIELGKHGITVNAICPNHVTTGLGAWQNEYFAHQLGLTLEAYMQSMRDRIPLGRPGLVDDTANVCAFLCSEQAQYVTGEAMNVSGGEEYH